MQFQRRKEQVCDSILPMAWSIKPSYQHYICSSSLALAPDSTLAAIYSVSHAFEVHNIKTHHLAQVLIFEEQSDLTFPPIAFAHDGFAIIGRVQGRACIWDIECGDELQVLNHGGKQGQEPKYQ
jgi:hypothetical protein